MFEILHKLHTFDTIREKETSDAMVIVLSLFFSCSCNNYNDNNMGHIVSGTFKIFYHVQLLTYIISLWILLPNTTFEIFCILKQCMFVYEAFFQCQKIVHNLMTIRHVCHKQVSTFWNEIDIYMAPEKFWLGTIVNGM